MEQACRPTGMHERQDQDGRVSRSKSRNPDAPKPVRLFTTHTVVVCCEASPFWRGDIAQEGPSSGVKEPRRLRGKCLEQPPSSVSRLPHDASTS